MKSFDMMELTTVGRGKAHSCGVALREMKKTRDRGCALATRALSAIVESSSVYQEDVG